MNKNKKNSIVVRTTKHRIDKDINTGKQSILSVFISEYKNTAQQYLDYLWNSEISFNTKEGIKQFDIHSSKLDHPKMLSNIMVEKEISNFKSNLSARAKKCCLTQVLGIIGSSIEKQRKRMYQYYETPSKQLLKKIKLNDPVKPDISKMSCELNSICADFILTPKNKNFNGFLRLKCLGSSYNQIKIPIKFNRNTLKYSSWFHLPSFLIGEKFIDLRWKKEISKRSEGNVISIDQGKTDIAYLSNGKTTPRTDIHGHSLESIIDKLSRKKKGSKAFKRSQDHRKNFINWSINQLNFDGIQRVNLEDIWNINYKKRNVPRSLKHWSNPLIRDKILSRCELLGVQVVMQSSTYRSQRCSACGLVRKSNRKGKFYSCQCGWKSDSDFNACKNHDIELPDVPYELRMLRKNLRGFYWKPEGFFELTGEAITVPLPGAAIKVN